ncbi:hypothetical protein Q3C01_27265 [Bradyrhizobium sp. UFLA05-109]
MKKLVAIGLLAIGAAFASPASATYPDRPIKLIVPFAAGGPTDVLARNLAEGLRALLPKPVIVENKPGAAQTSARSSSRNPSPTVIRCCSERPHWPSTQACTRRLDTTQSRALIQ